MKKKTSTILLSEIQKAKKGDQSAFNYLLHAFWDDIYRFQLRRTKNEYEAEDITIQSFAKAFDKISTFNDTYNFKNWIIQISKNIHLDLIRKQKSSLFFQKNFKDDTSGIYKIIDDNPTPEDLLITEQNHEQLLLFIKQLKPRYQKIIELRYFKELTYKEISEILKEPIGNIKIKILRAKRLLASIINKNQN